MSKEKPHVENLEDGNRNVDVYYNFQSEKELDIFLNNCELIGVGRTALAFLTPPDERCEVSEAVIRIEIINPLGYEWTKALIHKLIIQRPSFTIKLKELLVNVEKRLPDRSLKGLKKDTRRYLKKRIAGHNSTYRRNPLFVMPINSYFSFKGNPLGIRIKFLEGVSLVDAHPLAKLSSFAQTILDDENPANILIGIKNSVVIQSLIDISDFIPSSDSIDGEDDPLFTIN